MPDRPVSASLTSFAVRPQAVLRFYATVRADETVVPMAEIWQSLTLAGFGRDLHLWLSVRPSDWPSEDVPPVRGGQIVVRGQGTFLGDRLSTVVSVWASTATAMRTRSCRVTLQIWSVWDHADAGEGASGDDLPGAGARRGASPLLLLLLGLVGLAVASPVRGRRGRR